MNPIIEIVFPDFQPQILQDRYEMPLFFIVGGADDDYLSSLVGQDIHTIVSEKSVDPIPEKPYGVYASRYLLPTTGLARTFPLDVFLNKEWPILLDITEGNKSFLKPTSVQKVWIIRALRRMNYTDMAETLRNQLLYDIYPQKICPDKMPKELTVNSLAGLYLQLSEEQQNYPLVMIIDDLPIQLDKTLGNTLMEISITKCTITDYRALDTSLKLLSMK